MSLNWYAINTKPRKERQVERFLSESGIEIYLPTLQGPKQKIPVPFFAGYLFAHTDIDEVGLWRLHYVPGARGLVKFGDEPARVKEEFIADLRVRIAQMDVVDARGKVIEPGDSVVITDEAFADIDAVFDHRLDADGRARVLIHLMQRWVSVQVNVDALQKTGKLPRRDLVSRA